MKVIILLIIFLVAASFQVKAVVVVHSPNHSVSVAIDKSGDLNGKKKIKKNSFSFKKLFNKIARVFDFDLSDPVDGWLSLAILLIAGALVLLLLGGLIGSYALSFVGSILAIGAFVSFIIWVVKMI